MSIDIRLKRGLKAALPASAPEGQPLIATDARELYIGTGTGVAQITDVVFSASEPVAADQTKLWVDTANNVIKRYTGAAWVEVSAQPDLTSYATKAYAEAEADAAESAAIAAAATDATTKANAAQAAAEATAAADATSKANAAEASAKAYTDGVVDDYLPLTGGTVSSTLTVNGTLSTADVSVGGNLTLTGSSKQIDLGGNKIIGVATPVNDTDAATKAYVDAVATGLDIKGSVVAASSADVTVSAPGATIGGVTMVAGDRVLLFGQTDATENGIYVFNGEASALTRAADCDNTPGAEFTSGLFVFVSEGTYAGISYVVTTQNNTTIGGIPAIALGTTAITITEFGRAAEYTEGDGIDITGLVVSVAVDGSSIAKSATGIKVAESGVTATELASNAVTEAKLASSVVGNGLQGAAGSALSIKLGTDSGLSVDGSGLVISTVDGGTF